MPNRAHPFRTALALITTLVAASCASRTTPADSGADSRVEIDAVDVPPDNPLQVAVDVPQIDVAPAQEHDYVETIGPIHLDPGQEVTMCVLRPMQNETAQFVRSVTAHLGPSSHHLIFYRATATTAQPDPFTCRGFSGVSNFMNPDSPMLIAQMTDARIDMPMGTGMHIGPMQMIRLELHAINVTTAPVDVTGTVNIHTADATVPLLPADLLFWGNTNINIPAHSTADVHFYHQPWSSVHIFGLTSHTHHLGTLATISEATNTTTDSTMATDLSELHRSTSWSDPPLTLFDPPLQLPSGEGLHLVCHYNNTTDAPISFGESFNDEMCFMWAYYYPAPRGLQICADFGRGVVCLPP